MMEKEKAKWESWGAVVVGDPAVVLSCPVFSPYPLPPPLSSLLVLCVTAAAADATMLSPEGKWGGFW